MKHLWVVLLLLPLAGCLSPPTAPDHAETDRHEDMPGLKLSTWTDEHGDRWRIHALVVNDSDATYNYRIGCGEPWNVTLSGPSGHVEFRQVQEEPGCASQWEVLRPQGHIDTLYSWDFQDHDPAEGTSEPVEQGAYTWRIEFHLRDRDEILFTEHVRLVTTQDGAFEPEGHGLENATIGNVRAVGLEGELAGFELGLETRDDAQHTVWANVTNTGDGNPEYWRGCLMDWDWHILDPDGELVTVEPYGTCAGFANTTFPPGTTQTFTWTWNGQTYDHASETSEPAEPGRYKWVITFGLQGTGDESPTLHHSAWFWV